VTAISHDVPAAEPALTGLTVKDVMVTAPATMRPTATVADARAFFADDHVHMALIATSGRLLGTLVRADIDDLDDDAAPALSRSRLDGRSVALEKPAEDDGGGCAVRTGLRSTGGSASILAMAAIAFVAVLRRRAGRR